MLRPLEQTDDGRVPRTAGAETWPDRLDAVIAALEEHRATMRLAVEELVRDRSA